jgi:hypothetical protein
MTTPFESLGYQAYYEKLIGCAKEGNQDAIEAMRSLLRDMAEREDEWPKSLLIEIHEKIFEYRKQELKRRIGEN